MVNVLPICDVDNTLDASDNVKDKALDKPFAEPSLADMCMLEIQEQAMNNVHSSADPSASAVLRNVSLPEMGAWNGGQE